MEISHDRSEETPEGKARGNAVVVSGSNGFVNVITKAGDCNGDDIVSIAEVQSSINMYLGIKTVESCADINVYGVVSIAEVQKAIDNYLGL